MLIHIHYATRQGKKQVLSIIQTVENWINKGVFYLFLREGDKCFNNLLFFAHIKQAGGIETAFTLPENEYKWQMVRGKDDPAFFFRT